ncbi:MAG: protein phosphatase 2C domain-containing protein [Defluviitaleaceae bacterium]|nr:protein phosphatase 2C domain-containing protein [Defluviitaleaceae bacterium]
MTYFIVSCCLLLAFLIVRAALGNISGVLRLEFGLSQTPGNRQVNADEIDWAYYGDETFFAVADGIGSGDKAKTAARVAVHIISRVFEQTGVGGNPAYFFMNCFRGANSTILRYIPDSTAGASLLGAAIKDNRLYYALAGNCKISVFREGELYDLSEGHTFDILARNAFIRKEITRIDALEAAKGNRIYNFVGKDGFRDLEMFDTPVTLKKGDIILLMTDGVYEFCEAEALAKILSSRDSCNTMAKRITDTLDKSNHLEQDNASIIVARINAL